MEPDKEKARLEQEKVEAWKKKQYDLNSFERKQLKKRGVKICPESDLEFASSFLIISFAISVPFENNSVWFQNQSDWPWTESFIDNQPDQFGLELLKSNKTRNTSESEVRTYIWYVTFSCLGYN